MLSFQRITLGPAYILVSVGHKTCCSSTQPTTAAHHQLVNTFLLWASTCMLAACHILTSPTRSICSVVTKSLNQAVRAGPPTHQQHLQQHQQRQQLWCSTKSVGACLTDSQHRLSLQPQATTAQHVPSCGHVQSETHHSLLSNLTAATGATHP